MPLLKVGGVYGNAVPLGFTLFVDDVGTVF